MNSSRFKELVGFSKRQICRHWKRLVERPRLSPQTRLGQWQRQPPLAVITDEVVGDDDERLAIALKELGLTIEDVRLEFFNGSTYIYRRP